MSHTMHPRRMLRLEYTIGSGPRYFSRRVATKSGRITAVRIAPQIAQNSQLGKFAPAILTTGSHPASTNAAAIDSANLLLGVEGERNSMRRRFYAPDCAKARCGIQCSRSEFLRHLRQLGCL